MAGRAAIYTRLSKDRLEERSREDQEADCPALCAIKGFTVVTVHTDLESGYRRSARRPGYEARLEDLRAGAVDVVVIWKLTGSPARASARSPRCSTSSRPAGPR